MMDECATTAIAQVCITCLDTDSEMLSISEHHLEEAYQHLTGCSVFDISHLKHTLCEACVNKLGNFAKFREESLKARALLMGRGAPQEVVIKWGIDPLNLEAGSVKTEPADAQQLGILIKPERTDSPLRGLADSEYRVLPRALNGEALRCATASIPAVSPLRSCLENTDLQQHSGNEAVVKCEPQEQTDTDTEMTAADSEHVDYQTTDADALPTSATTDPATAAVVCSSVDSDGRNTKNNNNIVSTHSEDTYLFTCDGCQRQFKKKNSLKKHIVSFSKGQLLVCNKQFTCQFCQYKCSTMSCLLRHLVVHSGKKPFACKLCEYTCSECDDLLNHMRTHTGEKPFKCKFCNYKCSLKSDLVIHVKTHNGEKHYACNLCEYKGSGSHDLIKHMRTHTGEKPYACKLCEHKFAQKGTLVGHMRTHTGEKPYACNLCEFKSNRNGSLVMHMRTHTGEKPFACTLCQYKCSMRKFLVKHMRTHTGEKPFACKLCEYKCAQKCTLVMHMKKHTGEKPFACTLCEYRCSQKSSLQIHMRKHTGEKPFTCNLCDYKCARSNYLVIHMRKHTG